MIKQIEDEQKAERATQKALQRGEAEAMKEGVILNAQQKARIQLVPEGPDVDHETAVDERLMGLFFPFLQDYNAIE
jgi:hypothetical protein